MPEASPKRTRRQRTDPGVARESVLDAAEALLRAEGPAGLRLGAIATKAGLSHSNVLYHFDGMHDLEARLGRRIAMRLVEELEAMHRDTADGETARALATAHLFRVLSTPENARFIWWMLVSSDPVELEPLFASIRKSCESVAGHASLGDLPAEAVMREVVESSQLTIAAALGLGAMRPYVARVFGSPPDDVALLARLTIDRSRMERTAIGSDRDAADDG